MESFINQLKEIMDRYGNPDKEIGCNIYITDRGNLKTGSIKYGTKNSVDLKYENQPINWNRCGSFHTHTNDNFCGLDFSFGDVKDFIKYNEQIMFLGYKGKVKMFSLDDYCRNLIIYYKTINKSISTLNHIYEYINNNGVIY